MAGLHSDKNDKRPLLKRPWLIATTIGGALALGFCALTNNDDAPPPQSGVPEATNAHPPVPYAAIVYYDVVNDVPLAYGRILKAGPCVEEAFAPAAGASEISITVRTRATDASPPLTIETRVPRSNLTNRRERPSETSDCTATVESPAPQSAPR